MAIAGSGMEIAAAADMLAQITANTDAGNTLRYSIGYGSCVVAAFNGWGKSVELVLTGDHITAQQAHEYGYLQKLCPMISWTKR